MLSTVVSFPICYRYIFCHLSISLKYSFPFRRIEIFAVITLGHSWHTPIGLGDYVGCRCPGTKIYTKTGAWNYIRIGWIDHWFVGSFVIVGFVSSQWLLPLTVNGVYVDVIKWKLLRVTDPLCGESTGHRWIPLTKVSDAELWYFQWCAPEQTAEQTVQIPVIWDAMELIVTLL